MRLLVLFTLGMYVFLSVCGCVRCAAKFVELNRRPDIVEKRRRRQMVRHHNARRTCDVL